MMCHACAMTNGPSKTRKTHKIHSHTGFGQDPKIHKSITCNAQRGGPTERGLPYKSDGQSWSRLSKAWTRLGVEIDMAGF
eukprot:1547364-Rhodomonas_salina.1